MISYFSFPVSAFDFHSVFLFAAISESLKILPNSNNLKLLHSVPTDHSRKFHNIP